LPSQTLNVIKMLFDYFVFVALRDWRNWLYFLFISCIY
jgi:hypothetical protein